jgi:hypothetical protein
VIGNVWIVIFSIRNNLTAFVWGVITVAVGWIIYECLDGWLKKIVVSGRKRREGH